MRNIFEVVNDLQRCFNAMFFMQSEDDDTRVPVPEVMDTWTKQMGYPVFTVSQSSNTLTQTRFFSVQPENLSAIASSPYK